MLSLLQIVTNQGIALLSIAKRRLWKEDGATAVEYGLIVALIAVVIIVVVAALGGQLSTAFCNVVTTLNRSGIAGACDTLPTN